jgi:hypothetical protein
MGYAMSEQRREGESLTAFTLRQLRNETLEDAAKLIEDFYANHAVTMHPRFWAAFVRQMKEE